ncbi:MAG: M15 family metallopeptidase [Patescibacteria group bacterium]
MNQRLTKKIAIIACSAFLVVVGSSGLYSFFSSQKLGNVPADVLFVPNNTSKPSSTAEPISAPSCPINKASERAKKVGILHLQYPEARQSDLVDAGSGNLLHKDAYRAFLKMKDAAKSQGVDLFVISGFRSIAEQKIIVDGKVAKGFSEAKIFSASSDPGYSEHHTGYAADLNSLDPSLANSKTAIWLKENATKYQFEISFPEGNFQGIMHEWWHVRFVGTEEAKNMFCYASSKTSK